MSRILKWTVPVDDNWHEIGHGDPAMVADDPNHLYQGLVWTIEPSEETARIQAEQERIMNLPPVKRMARIYGTGMDYPSNATYLGSFRDGQFVWHVVAMSVRDDD